MDSKPVKQRSLKQNASAHMWFTHISNTLNDSGLEMQVVLAKRASIFWTPESVKEVLFKGVMKAMYPGKKSTTELSTKEFSKVSEALQMMMARDYEVSIDIPSQESLANEQTERVWK